MNKGQPRKPDDWGSLRVWAWGAARGLDYLETEPSVDAKKVGIEGVSRYGKAALVTLAFEPRFAIVLVGSSGEGGAKLHRRNFGGAIQRIYWLGEYHWMAGKFLKYGTAESSFGSKNAGDLPVDAHELIALCAHATRSSATAFPSVVMRTGSTNRAAYGDRGRWFRLSSFGRARFRSDGGLSHAQSPREHRPARGRTCRGANTTADMKIART